MIAGTMEYVVAWFANGNNWVEIARVADKADAEMFAQFAQSKLSDNAIFHGEEYKAFAIADFDLINGEVI
jgi:hypothetical protein